MSCRPTLLAPSIAQLALGAARVLIVREATVPWAPRFTGSPEAEGLRSIDIELVVYVVEEAGRLLVVDAGLGEGPGRERVLARWPGARTGATLEQALALLGATRHDVRDVLLTHAHEDHVAGVLDAHGAPRFPEARVWLGRADRSRATYELPMPPAVSDLLEQLGARLELFDGRRAVTGHTELWPCPGESPGHAAVVVKGATGELLLLGDLVHHPVEVAEPRVSPPGRDGDALLESRRAVFAWAAQGERLVAATHFAFPGVGHIVEHGSSFAFRAIT